MRQKLQNRKGYAESPEFLPALGLFNSRGKLDPSLLPTHASNQGCEVRHGVRVCVHKSSKL